MKKPLELMFEGLTTAENRGDKTAIELFVAGMRGWEVSLRRYLSGNSD
jgi:hypothetical protein